MNKINGTMIMMLLSVAIVLVAPQALAATFDFLFAAPTEIQSGIPGGGEKYTSDPVATCTVDRASTENVEGARAHMEAYPEIASLSSSCSGAGSELRGRDVEETGVIEMMHY